MYMKIKTLHDEDLKSVVEHPILMEIVENEVIEPEHVDIEAKYGVSKAEIPHYSTWKPKFTMDRYDVEGAFPGLHYLITGTTELAEYPLNFLCAPHRVVTEMGWGPVNTYFAREVQEIVSAIDALDYNQLIKKYDPSDFQAKRILRGYTWKKEDIYSMLDQLKDIRNFLFEACSNGKGIYIIVQ